jgi:pimeloyl-ACP methyl ester carboxylesterase
MPAPSAAPVDARLPELSLPSGRGDTVDVVTTRRTVVVRGDTVSYLEAGPRDGAAILLLHGLASDATTWDKAIDPLAAQGLRVIAIDLLGHGESDKPAGSYLLADFAAFLGEFLPAIGIEHATVCGHSLGGAIAVHFGYHYPSFVDGLVLVSAGGLGREVHPMLRAAAVPGADRLLAVATAEPMWRIYRHPRLHRMLRLTDDNLINLRRASRALRAHDGRAAFFAALRGVIEPAGQRDSFVRMNYLRQQVPTLLVWSERDGVIPVRHAYATRDHLRDSELVVFPGGGHEPHRRHAERFADEVARFVQSHAVG